MNDDLLKAILAMDSYNRGYNPGIDLGLGANSDAPGTKIGTAIVYDSKGDAAAQADSFYAIAYILPTGEKVISYRGTDSPLDVIAGWVSGLIPVGQAVLAAEFYKAVIGAADPYTANVTFTGHSLGGGLAGFIASLYAKNATIFDNMPFEATAYTAWTATGGPYGFFSQQPNWSHIKAYDVTGEILESFRNLQGTPVQHLSSLGGIRSPRDLHSQALLTTLLFASTEQTAGRLTSDWQKIGAPFIDALFNDKIGQALSLEKNVNGTKGPADKMLSMIAYSAIDEGTRIFGDTGIKAMFNDATDLGKALNLAGVSKTLQEASGGIAQTFVQFAGGLAVNKVLQSGNADLLSGVLALSADSNTLAIDFSDALWKRSNNNVVPSLIVGRQELTDVVFNKAGFVVSFGIDGAPIYTPIQDIRTGMKWLWNDDTSSVVDRVVLATHDIALTTTIADRAVASTKVSLFAAGSQDDTITGSSDNDFLYGGDGKDTLKGGNGNDLLAGGNGDDTFSGGAGNDFYAGGAGKDTVTYGGASSINLTVKSIPASGASEATIEMYAFANDIDRAIQVEKVLLSSGNDRLNVSQSNTRLGFNVLLDGGTNTAAGDILDFSASTTGVNLHDAKPNAATDFTGLTGNPFAVETYGTHFNIFGNDFFLNPTGMRFTNFEQVIGSSKNDTFNLEHLSPNGELTAAQRVQLDAARAMVVNLGNPTVVGSQLDAIVEKARLVPQNQQNVLIDAGAGDDVVKGTETGANTISGGAGNDKLEAGGFTSLIHGDAGDDILIGGGFKSQLYGDAGKDIFKLANNTFIMDADTTDRLTWGPLALTGGVQQWWNEDGYAYWTPFTSLAGIVNIFNADILAVLGLLLDSVTATTFRYALTDSNQLVIQYARGRGGQAVLENYNLDIGAGTATGNIFAFKQVIQKASIQDYKAYLLLAMKAAGIPITGTDPLIIDLNKNGLDLTTIDKGVYFDLDTDNFAERSSWVAPSDGFLARDVNGNGKIDNISELFGNATTSGFTQLRTLDSNADNKITSADAAFSTLRVWQDANGNGITDAGELKTLAQVGISQISLTTNAPATGTVKDSTVQAEAIVTFSDGTTSKISDVRLNNSQIDSTYLGNSTVSATAAAHATLKGYGNITNLNIGTTNDATLLNKVIAFEGSGLTKTWAQLQTSAADILYRWAGVDTVAATSMGGGTFDQRKLAFLEKYYGQQMTTRDAQGKPVETNLSQLITSWNDAVDKATVRLAVQGPLKTLFSGITYDAASDRFLSSTTTALADSIKLMFGQLSTTAATALTQWNTIWGPLLSKLDDSLRRVDRFDVKADYVMQSLIKASDGLTLPLTLAQLSTGIGLQNVHIGTDSIDNINRPSTDTTNSHIYVGGKGNDTLTGGTGQDVYVYGKAFGQDTIYDSEKYESGDRIRFALYKSTDVTMTRSGNDLVISVIGTSDKITVKDQFITPTVDFNGTQISAQKGVEEIQFSDGVVMEKGDMAAAVGKGTNGIDTLLGTGTADELEGLKGNDLLKGGDSGDTYYFTRGDGNDTIQDIMTAPLLSGADSLILLGIDQSNMHFARTGSSNDLLISFDWTGDSILLKDQFMYTPLGYQTKLALDNRVEAVFFSQGEGISWLDLQTLTLAAYTTAGNDTTYAFGTSDILYASAGDDLLVGFDGGDTYHFGIGSGNDRIDDNSQYPETFISGLVGYSWGPDDVLVFDGNILPSDVTFARLGAAPDLQIKINSTGETMTILSQFTGVKLDLFNLLGIAWFDRVEKFQFSDGTTMTWEDVLHIVTTGTAGNDNLYGALYPDLIDGKAGNDYMSGGDDGDTYLFGRGYGQDIIEDKLNNVLVTAADTVQFGAGISSSDIVFTHIPNTDDLLITIAGTNDTLTIRNQYTIAETGVFGAQSFYQIERFVFADGTVKNWDTLRQEIIDAAKTTGNDVIYGSHFDDIIAGGLGNDLLKGGDGNDTYLFNRDDGNDVVQDNEVSIFAGHTDTILFGAGILPSDIIMQRAPGLNDVMFYVAGTNDSIQLLGQFSYTTINFRPNEIENFKFADGTVWTADQLRDVYIAKNQTSGNDIIDGFYTGNAMEGGAGNDILRGGDGADIYRFSSGFGHDIIEESVTQVTYSDDDSIVFGAGITMANTVLSRIENDLIISFTNSTDSINVVGQFSHSAYFSGWWDIETIKFADGSSWTDAQIRTMLIAQPKTAGNDVIRGFYGDDILDGGAGNDTLIGYGGGDTYLFGRGSGKDTIEESINSPYEDIADTVQFGANIVQSDLTFLRKGKDLRIVINGTNDQLTIHNHFDSLNYNAVENFKFTNGTVLTRAQVAALAPAITTTTINGTANADTIVGTAANEIINASNGNDTITGGKGDDTLSGGSGADTFIINQGDGDDSIDGGLDNDTVSFGAGITWNNLSFDFEPGTQNILITVPGGGTLKMPSMMDSFGVETFRFADGTVKTQADVKAAALAAHSTPGNDLINAIFPTGDTITGGKGNDVMWGSKGADTFIINQGDGYDVIDGGFDNDTVQFGAGITWAGLTFGLESGTEDFLINLPGGGTLELMHMLDAWGVETFKFADGTVKTSLDVARAYISGMGTAGNDRIYGLSIADIISGGEGNDVIDGGRGNDTITDSRGNDIYFFTLGDGQDVITDSGEVPVPLLADINHDNRVDIGDMYIMATNWYTPGPGGDINHDGMVDSIDLGFLAREWQKSVHDNDTIQFDSGINASNIALIRSQTDSNDLIIRYGTSGDQVTLHNAFGANTSGRVENILLADETLLNVQALMDQQIRTINGTANPDTLHGFADQNSTINGLGGNDTLTAGAWGDVLKGGDGNDTLNGGAWIDGLYGNAGKDTMTGGAMGDTFYFTNNSDSTTVATTRDIITDFNQADGDHIDLTALGNFTFDGTGALINNGIAQIHYSQSGGNTIVDVDSDGNGVANFQIQMTGLINLTHSDFLV